MSEKNAPLYLIDAYGLIYRSYFAFLSRPLRNSAGKNVSALFGFARMVTSLLIDGAPTAAMPATASATEALTQSGAKEPPRRMAAVFDSRVPTFRHKMYSEYKATREKAPEDLHSQIPLVEEFLAALNIPVLKADGFEADDIIATLAEKCRSENRPCYILSSDKDLLQLVGGGIYALRPAKIVKSDVAGSGPVLDLVGPAEVKAEWGVAPEKILDLLSLTGDSSDNIPGVKGIGPKIAVDLMTRHSSLDNIFKNIASIGGASGRKLAEGKESAYFSRSLIKLVTDVSLKITGIDELSSENLDRRVAARVLLREGIRQSAKQLDPNAGAPSADAPDAGSSDASCENPQYRKEIHQDKSLIGNGVYKAILDIAELKTILAEAKKQKLLAIDFETDSLDAWNSRPVGISIALKPKEAFYVPLVLHGVPDTPEKESPPPHLYVDAEKARMLLAPLFADPEMTVIAHNAKFDYKVSRGWGIDRWQCKIRDTMVAAWIVDPERINYSQDSLVEYTFDHTPMLYRDIVPKGRTFDAVPLETAVCYSGEDADFCLRLMLHLEPRLAAAGATDLFENIEMPLLPILAEMEGLGIKIESEILTDYGSELAVELEGIQQETWKIVGHEFNLASTKQLQEVLFVERGLVPVKKTKTGLSTDADALEKLARADPVPALILRHRTLAKLKSTYVDTLAGMADGNGRLHTHFVQTGTATGRLSSREPNLQNIPIRAEEGRRIREAFIASTGNVLISADYSQIELAVLAHLSKDKNLIAAFNEGTDVHSRTAALIFSVGEKDVKNEQRRIAKTINFGVIYGMSAFRLADELNISRTDAAGFIEAYYKTYSGVKSFFDKLIEKTEECGYVSTILGRRRFIPNINSRNKTEKAAAERIARNTPIQGSAADIVKTAMVKLDKRLQQEQSPARLLLQVHDELIFECPKDSVKLTAALVKEEMEQAVNLSVPLRVSVETGRRWGTFH